MSKNILKLGLFSILLLATLSIEAQKQGQGQRGGQSQNRSKGQGMNTKFNAENVVGILTYNNKKVLKKTKVKKAKKKNSIKKIISEYNHSIDEIRFSHAVEFRATEEFVAQKRKETVGNREAMRSIQSDAMKKLMHIKSKVHKAEQMLNNKLEQVLSEKQYTKWLKHQKSKKQKLKPQRPNRANQGRSRQSGSGGRQRN